MAEAGSFSNLLCLGGSAKGYGIPGQQREFTVRYIDKYKQGAWKSYIACANLQHMTPTPNRATRSRPYVGMYPGSGPKRHPMPSSLVCGAPADSDRLSCQVSRISSLELPPIPRCVISRQYRATCGNSALRPEGLAEDELLSEDSRKSANCATAQLWQQLKSSVSNKQGVVVTLAALVLLVGFQFDPKAWAGTEVAAKINLTSGPFDLGDWSDIESGFAGAFLLILFSEIGDKTFFIAALLATRKSGVAVFSGTFGALVAMTVISVTLGRAFHYVDGILPSFGDTKLPVDDISAAILLVYFGVSTLIDAAGMEDSGSGEEKKEAELAIANVGAGGAVAGTAAATFALVFVAEWGDKSFFSTIALAAASSPLGVVAGATAGHGAATLLAVLGGSFLGNYVSDKVIAYTGGVLFLVFAATTLVQIVK